MKDGRRLSQEEIAFFKENGYLAVRGAVSREKVQASIEATCAYLGADLDDPATWWNNHPENWDQVPIHHPQAFWDIRQDPDMYAIYADLWGTERLWVSIDRASFKPPMDSAHPNMSRPRRIHWDVDPIRPEGHYIQGLVYLTPTPVESGALEVVPGIYRDLQSWFAEHSPVDQFMIEVNDDEIVRMPGSPGDLVVWDSRMPHSAGENHGPKPRLVQYVQHFPPPMDEDRDDRILCWRERRPPPQHRGWENQEDPEARPIPVLTPLGERLLGLREWE